ncbi:uncharacterized protein SCHCODRAFT_02615631 [Schizophyllum commune H4-8]|uniref:uncharacterized protein n=1 Tax=Schizophyllum commune (strain H4-8 / FGSC 9210) TaxID=578458 RepID=UPI002160C500|nr:uncharacterized protein SCHCODRAFT_02615631 [Schizophyllum commune H4-8]KAI5896715.1 hypothetical protein SCHCODRAFT_02615631 [Schizophyllum commune H4-8]
MAHWRPPTLEDLGDRSFDSEEESSSGSESAGTRSRRTSLLSESISELDYYDEDSSDEELDGQRPLKRARWDEPTTEASSPRVAARDSLAPPFLEYRFDSPWSRAQWWHWCADWTRYFQTGFFAWSLIHVFVAAARAVLQLALTWVGLHNMRVWGLIRMCEQRRFELKMMEGQLRDLLQ